MSGTLFVVATPIGNLEDLTPRARQTLESVSLVAAEDTRHTGRLLSSFGAKPRLMALHDHNESEAVQGVIEALQSGNDVALVSDAGTPLVSDPGFRLVRTARDEGIPVVPIPGASAVTAALSVAGLATDRFCFEGFLPHKRVARRSWLEDLAGEQRSMVFFESVHRIGDSLADMVAVFGADREAFVGREMTKLHEQCVRAPLGELLAQVESGEIKGKGEYVLVVAGSSAEIGSSLDMDRLLLLLDEKLGAKEASKLAAEITGGKKNALYGRVLELRNKSGS